MSAGRRERRRQDDADADDRWRDRADRGGVTVHGTVGFVHQHSLLVSEFTIAENLALAIGRKTAVDFDRRTGSSAICQSAQAESN
jgi:ABC-type uncharacterized transport system ATPase subunit